MPFAGFSAFEDDEDEVDDIARELQQLEETGPDKRTKSKSPDTARARDLKRRMLQAKAGQYVKGYHFCIIDVSDYSVLMADSAADPSGLPEARFCYELMYGRSKPCPESGYPCPIVEMTKTGRAVTLEHTYKRSGSPHVLEIHAYPIFDRKGHLKEIVEYCLDVTRHREKEDQLRRLSRRIIEVQEGQRKRIATKLHEGVVQTLSSIKFRIGGLQEARSGSTTERKTLEKVEEFLKESISELRRISKELRPDILEHMGLAAATETFCRDFEARTGIACKVKCSMSKRFPEDIELVLYRIVQEALANVEAHSGAKTVALSFSRAGSDIILRIRDNGKGFNLDKVEARKGGERGCGLLDMKERADLLDGKLDIITAPGKGTEIVATVAAETRKHDRNRRRKTKRVRSTRK